MPFTLLFAIAASLGIHALALFGPDVDLSTMPEPPPLVAELQPVPEARPPVEPAPRPEKKARMQKPRAVRPLPASPASATPVLGIPAEIPVPEIAASPEPEVQESTAISVAGAGAPTPEASRLPARGMIRYRVDRGDQGFEIGHSTHDWEFVDGTYRITAVTETSGLVALFKPLRIELESRGRLTAAGLQPESFLIRRAGKETGETAAFDWEQMQVRIGGGAAQNLSTGAQDLLSFHYQLGFLPHPEARNALQIATGKKYETYRLEAVGDEEIEIPAGTFRTLHLRAPGDNTTELWLAYDYLLLPVKIRHLDRKGDSFVQVATELRLSKE